MAQPRGRKVLVVAADGATRMALQRGLGDDVTVTGASDVAQAVRFVVADEPDVIVLDLTLDPGGYGSGGSHLLGRLRSRGLRIPPVVVVSDRPGGAEIAKRVDAAAYFRKPLDVDALAARIRELFAATSVGG